MRTFPQLTEDETLRDVVSVMDEQIHKDLRRDIPRVRKFIDEIEEELNEATKEKRQMARSAFQVIRRGTW